MDKFNPLLPGRTDAGLLEMFIEAAKMGVMETFRLMPLEKQKIFVNKIDPRKEKFGNTALTAAVLEGKAEVVAHLLTLKPDMTLSDKNGWLPLNAAAYKGEDKIVGLLLDAGADIDHADDGGWTPLSDAISGNHASTVLYLLSRNANPNKRNEDGSTSVDVAIVAEMDSVVPALKEAALRHNSLDIARNFGKPKRDLPAPSRAQFRKKAS